MLSEALTIGFDRGTGKDFPVLTVGELKDGKITILNTFVGGEAMELHYKLVGTTLIEHYQRALDEMKRKKEGA